MSNTDLLRALAVRLGETAEGLAVYEAIRAIGELRAQAEISANLLQRADALARANADNDMLLADLKDRGDDLARERAAREGAEARVRKLREALYDARTELRQCSEHLARATEKAKAALAPKEGSDE